MMIPVVRFENHLASLISFVLMDHDSELAARAAVEAADALARIGQRNEAITFYRDVLVRFPQASFAQDAEAGLKSLTTTSVKPTTEGTNR